MSNRDKLARDADIIFINCFQVPRGKANKGLKGSKQKAENMNEG